MNLADLLAGPVLPAAQGLLGMRLRTEMNGAVTEVIVSEVEAYAGAEDPASHAYRGRTKSNPSMFGEPGTIYVYRSYGMHWCMNVVTAPKGIPSAVLLRAGIPTEGIGIIEARRGRKDHLTDGPGKLCQALGVNGEHDGLSILADGPISLHTGDPMPGTVLKTPRVGISKAKERLWRFVVAQPAG